MTVTSGQAGDIDIYIRVNRVRGLITKIQGAYAENSGLWASIACSRRCGR